MERTLAERVKFEPLLRYALEGTQFADQILPKQQFPFGLASKKSALGRPLFMRATLPRLCRSSNNPSAKSLVDKSLSFRPVEHKPSPPSNPDMLAAVSSKFKGLVESRRRTLFCHADAMQIISFCMASFPAFK